MRAESTMATIWPSDTRSRVIGIGMVVILVLVIASLASYFLLEGDEGNGQTDVVTLAAFAHPPSEPTAESEIVSHLSVTDGSPDDTSLSMRLTDDSGADIESGAEYDVSVALTNLSDGTKIDAITPEADGDASTPTYSLDDPGMESEGWWRILLTVQPPDSDALVSTFYVQLPDPNLQGFDAPPSPDTDPEAEEMLSTAITQMSEWTSLRWWQRLSGGNDSLIIGDFAVTTTDSNGEPGSFENNMYYSAGFQRSGDAEPARPKRDHYSAVTIGEDAWIGDASGTIREASPIRYLPIDRYPETYEGATNVVFGIEEEVNGRMAQVVTFHVPTQPTQSEAWYLFWIDTETGDVVQLAMIATNHYMTWIYSDVNEDFVIEPPEGVEATPAT